MPDITGQVVILTVTDAGRSAAWYCDLLGAEETGRYVQPDGRVALVSITEPGSRLELCLACHDADAGSSPSSVLGLITWSSWSRGAATSIAGPPG